MQRIRDACHVISKEHAASGNQEDIAMDNKLKVLLKKDYVILDGGMGTMLQAAGMKMGETPEMLNITQPELLISIHEKYLNAGSDIIYANTFGGNRYKLEECGHSVHELVTAGIKNARAACDNVKPEALVALDVGPWFYCLSCYCEI